MVFTKKLAFNVLIFAVCHNANAQIANTVNKKAETKTSKNLGDKDLKKIEILNIGTFHMGKTNDANQIEFDENDTKNQLAVKKIAAKLSLFRPTVIIVEMPPENDAKLQNEYSEYVSNPTMQFKNPSEIQLLAYELGRISGAKRIYGIDHKMSYNYNIGAEMQNSIDSLWHNKYYKNPFKYHPQIIADDSKLSLLDKLKQINQNTYLDFLIAVNAEMLSHVGSAKGFEGADEATKYYQRNIRMYSNLNRIILADTDRVFILLGASHTAYFRDFFSRSPKYKMINTFDYLK